MLLAIDTSTRIGSVALFDGERLVAHRVLDASDRHGSALAPAVAEIAGADLARIECYALTIGPGSFTGLRIGLAFVKGVAFVYPRPIVPISTLEVIARGVFDRHPDAARALGMLDARRGEAYAGLYRSEDDDVATDASLVEGAYPVESIAPALARASGVIAAGDGVELAHGESPPWRIADRALWVADARVLGRMASARRRKGPGVEVVDLEPTYHQLSPAEANLRTKIP